MSVDVFVLGRGLPLMGVFPVSVDDSERDILVWRTSSKYQKDSIVANSILDQFVRRSLRLVNKVWIEDIELVSLYDLWWRIVRATG